MAYYLDTSALVKFVVAEPESQALRDWAEQDRDLVACDLARTELMRVVKKASPDRMLQARTVLDAMILMPCSTALFEQAGRLEPAGLRSLDAIHLASALDLGDDLEAMVTYDDRLADAARRSGVAVIAPN